MNQNAQKMNYTLTFDTSQANLDCFIRNKIHQDAIYTQFHQNKQQKITNKLKIAQNKTQKFEENLFLESVLSNVLNDEYVNSGQIKKLIENKDCCFGEEGKTEQKKMQSMPTNEDFLEAFTIIQPENHTDLNYKSIIYSCQLDHLTRHYDSYVIKSDKNQSYSTYQNSFSMRSDDFSNYPYYQASYQYGGFFPDNNYQYPIRKRKTGSTQEGDYKIVLSKVETDGRTTLMIRHIPNKYTQDMLLEEINRNNRLKFNFLYLPIDYSNSCNVGYAFINFIHTKFIVEFYKEFNGKRWNKFNSEKICQLTYARIQGTTSLLDHFQHSFNRDRKLRQDDPENKVDGQNIENLQSGKTN